MTAPGTAALHESVMELGTKLDELAVHIQKQAERRRAMELSWVDEDERMLGYGEKGKQPRTAEIRKDWRQRGEPPIGNGR